MTSNLPKYTLDEIAKHNTPSDLWIGVLGYVYDVTKFLDDHPGGQKPIISMAGKDATEYFMKIKSHHSNLDVPKLMVKYCVGRIA